jgi:uncharacterized protein YcbX
MLQASLTASTKTMPYRHFGGTGLHNRAKKVDQTKARTGKQLKPLKSNSGLRERALGDMEFHDQRYRNGNEWIDQTLMIADKVRLRGTGPCRRCVMTTLDLPRDTGILKTAAKLNQVNVGVYASVLTGGVIRC